MMSSTGSLIGNQRWWCALSCKIQARHSLTQIGFHKVLVTWLHTLTEILHAKLANNWRSVRGDSRQVLRTGPQLESDMMFRRYFLGESFQSHSWSSLTAGLRLRGAQQPAIAPHMQRSDFNTSSAFHRQLSIEHFILPCPCIAWEPYTSHYSFGEITEFGEKIENLNGVNWLLLGINARLYEISNLYVQLNRDPQSEISTNRDQ